MNRIARSVDQAEAVEHVQSAAVQVNAAIIAGQCARGAEQGVAVYHRSRLRCSIAAPSALANRSAFMTHGRGLAKLAQRMRVSLVSEQPQFPIAGKDPPFPLFLLETYV
jgi:hypothetical protein